MSHQGSGVTTLSELLHGYKSQVILRWQNSLSLEWMIYENFDIPCVIL